MVSFLQITLPSVCIFENSVADTNRLCLDPDPDPGSHVNLDPDPGSHVNLDPDPKQDPNEFGSGSDLNLLNFLKI